MSRINALAAHVGHLRRERAQLVSAMEAAEQKAREAMAAFVLDPSSIDLMFECDAAMTAWEQSIETVAEQLKELDEATAELKQLTNR